MTNGTETVVAELTPSQIGALVEGAVVKIVSDSVTADVGELKSDVSVLVPTADSSEQF